MSGAQTNVQLSNHGGVSFSFLPKGEGGQNEIVWITGGGVQVCIRVQSTWQTSYRGGLGHAPHEILISDILINTIWWNLGLFLHKHVSLTLLQLIYT